MKTKITLFVLVCIVATSCTKWRWHDHENNEDIELTESNYFFEGDLTKFALEMEIDSLENRAATLEKQLSNNPDLEPEFNDTVELLNETVAVNESISSSDFVFRRIPRGPIPLPPGPDIIPDDLQYILSNEVTELTVEIFNEEGELVAQNEGDLRNVPRTGGVVQYQNISFFDPEFVGPVTVQITRVNEEGIGTNVEFDAFKETLF